MAARRILLCQECKRQWDVSPFEVGQKLKCLCGFLMVVPRVQPHTPDVHHCQSCGAPRPRTTVVCGYCGAVPVLASTRMSLVCPHCLCRTADSSRFCQSCGESIAPAPMDHLTGNLRCPRCKKLRLFNRKIAEFTVDECPNCEGLWIARDIFERIVEQQVKEREERTYAHVVRTFQPGDGEPGIVYLKCPRCARHMNRRNFAKASGVVIDECRDDGIWLDRDELHKVAEYVASGGLRRTKQIEMRELAEEKRRLESQVHMPAGNPLFNSEPVRPGNVHAYADLGAAFFEGLTDFLDWIKR